MPEDLESRLTDPMQRDNLRRISNLGPQPRISEQPVLAAHDTLAMRLSRKLNHWLKSRKTKRD